MNCQACGKRLVRKRFPSGLEDLARFRLRKYCDQACMATGYEGQIKNPTPQNSRRQSAKKRKAQCELCGKPGRHVHHRDENPLNNEASNLQTLCVSCHRRSHSPNFMGTAARRKPCLHCSKPAVKKGLCWTHNTRRKKYGDPLLTKVKVGSKFVFQRVDS